MASHSNSPQQPPEPSQPPGPSTPLRSRRGALADIFSILDHNGSRNTMSEARTVLINAALFPAAPDADTSCPICITAFAPASPTAIALPCRHIFDRSCILEWLHTHNTCPLCRRAVFEEPAPAPPNSSPASLSSVDGARDALEELYELNAVDALDSLYELYELDALDELDVLDELDALDALDAALPLYAQSPLPQHTVEDHPAEPLSPSSTSRVQAGSLDARWTAHQARHIVTVSLARMLTASVTRLFFAVLVAVEQWRRDELDAAMYRMFHVAGRLDGRVVEVEVLFESLVAAGMEEVEMLRRRQWRRRLREIAGRVFRRVLRRESGDMLPDLSVEAVRGLARRMVNSQRG
ncbi:hypothetical protein BKCO1_830001 [Neofusicoccum parvum]|nr:hypothetical protein BKCO1_830001 [Neofusicoccum parvum]